MATEFTLAGIADRIGGQVHGDGSIRIARVRDLAAAEPGDLSFLSNPRYRPLLARTRASAVIVGAAETGAPCAIIRVADPYLGLCRALQIFHPAALPRSPGTHPSAVVDPTASVSPKAHVGPNCVVEAGARIRNGVVLRASVFVGERSTVGEDSYLYPGVVVREGIRIGKRVILHPGVVIGADGFGYAREGSAHRKIPQVGGVEIGDDVEIGANSTVDRGALGDTRIGRGTKIDNLVMVAHNVVVGEDCILVAQAGIAGSTKIGDRVTIAAQAGLTGHIEIGDDAVIGPQSGIPRSLPAGAVVSGTPPLPHRENMRLWAATPRISRTPERLDAVEKKLRALEARRKGRTPPASPRPR
ncbi:MAG TPA: UDP-3-O-(3-hydroxymyristoyl)glucosamine N-acyltransferase [Planctomycetota bacterium]|jgi:UDP-3-O-[3-hydroxymyristoyl] glucosamine N-acyltransferase|nr:UDP-3-O-(3-hydroxymyristoyl)glucosamine N-acyltransferase [Planctomycetota bacterium]